MLRGVGRECTTIFSAVHIAGSLSADSENEEQRLLIRGAQLYKNLQVWIVSAEVERAPCNLRVHGGSDELEC